MAGFGQYGWVWLLALAAIVGFALYRRGRRLIGHQRFDRRRIVLRIVLLAALIVFVLYSYARRPQAALAWESAAAGFVIGALIAAFALRFTRMGRDERGLWYVPNLYLGIGLIALLVARFVYEYVVIFPRIRGEAAAAAASGQHIALTPQPVLHGVLFVVLGYYLVYYAGIYLRARRLESEQPPGPDSPS